ncbi:MAG: hypothetical protein AVDCRST_MAG52-1456, partial [uncultured Blastococcus sp.]
DRPALVRVGGHPGRAGRADRRRRPVRRVRRHAARSQRPVGVGGLAPDPLGGAPGTVRRRARPPRSIAGPRRSGRPRLSRL